MLLVSILFCLVAEWELLLLIISTSYKFAHPFVFSLSTSLFLDVCIKWFLGKSICKFSSFGLSYFLIWWICLASILSNFLNYNTVYIIITVFPLSSVSFDLKISFGLEESLYFCSRDILHTNIFYNVSSPFFLTFYNLFASFKWYILNPSYCPCKNYWAYFIYSLFCLYFPHLKTCF